MRYQVCVGILCGGTRFQLYLIELCRIQVHKSVPGLFLAAMSKRASHTGGCVDCRVVVVMVVLCSSTPVVSVADKGFV